MLCDRFPWAPSATIVRPYPNAVSINVVIIDRDLRHERHIAYDKRHTVCVDFDWGVLRIIAAVDAAAEPRCFIEVSNAVFLAYGML